MNKKPNALIKQIITTALGLLFFCQATTLLAERTTTYLHTDGLGSVVAASDEDGNVLWRKSYAPYGSQIDEQEDDQKLSYTGKPHDDDLGLTYFGARWYDPQAGRFTGIDPVGFMDSNPQSFNRYAYANNNPYKYVDPDGQLPILIPVVIFIAKEVVAEGLSQATGGATDLLSVRRMGTKMVKGGYKLAKEKFKSEGFHEVLTEAPISGSTRSAHRNAANKSFADALESDSDFAKGMNNLLGKDVLQHMKSGKNGLKNPPGAEWHHPKEGPGTMQLLRREVHRDKSLRDSLHKDGTGGFADHFK